MHNKTVFMLLIMYNVFIIQCYLVFFLRLMLKCFSKTFMTNAYWNINIFLNDLFSKMT